MSGVSNSTMVVALRRAAVPALVDGIDEGGVGFGRGWCSVPAA
jgi:hypothetical protein